ncbi:hypothetical protein Cgig2_010325 [Carnegiea gigantea]|uniref:Uncharacterized protein n=1 Tax=Carnegiea gigantea TaxID=171969 RepID=A0A9Q1GMH9_9CARY|nr:hypothetical protein Cgig2_010325 [Carnegiea gigantea]
MVEEVESHILYNGFLKNYKIWNHHREPKFTPSEGSSQRNSSERSTSFSSRIRGEDDMEGMVYDTFGVGIPCAEPVNGSSNHNQPNEILYTISIVILHLTHIFITGHANSHVARKSQRLSQNPRNVRPISHEQASQRRRISSLNEDSNIVESTSDEDIDTLNYKDANKKVRGDTIYFRTMFGLCHQEIGWIFEDTVRNDDLCPIGEVDWNKIDKSYEGDTVALVREQPALGCRTVANWAMALTKEPSWVPWPYPGPSP